jgi:hypothetical protein
MILVVGVLLVVAIADLLRFEDLRPRAAPILRASIPAAIFAAFFTWATGISWWYAAVGVAAPLWVLGTTTWRRSLAPWALGLLGLAVATGIALSAWIEQPAGWLQIWYENLDIAAVKTAPYEQFLMFAAAILFAVSSANVFVRSVLFSSGTVSVEGEETLKGGRIIGPIERSFILVMACLGQYLAIASVIAAKSILRFPEIGATPPPSARTLISTRHRSGTQKKTAEYVLVGSFTSWALALVLALLVLAQAN